MCNSKFLLSCNEDRPSLKKQVDDLCADVSRLERKINKLSSTIVPQPPPHRSSYSQVVKKNLQPKLNNSQRHQGNSSKPSKPRPPLAPLCTARIFDPSGLSNRFSIGHMIKGVFSWDFPEFEIEEFPASPGKVYSISIETPFSDLHHACMGSGCQA